MKVCMDLTFITKWYLCMWKRSCQIWDLHLHWYPSEGHFCNYNWQLISDILLQEWLQRGLERQQKDTTYALRLSCSFLKESKIFLIMNEMRTNHIVCVDYLWSEVCVDLLPCRPQDQLLLIKTKYFGASPTFVFSVEKYMIFLCAAIADRESLSK